MQTLAELRPDFVKIDQSLVRGVDRDPARCAILEALVLLADRLGSLLVAEGIETVGALDVVSRPGIAYGQGYYLAPHAERVADRLAAAPVALPELAGEAEAAAPPKRFRAPLTHANRSRWAKRSGGNRLRTVCRRCGADLGARRRTCCDACLPAVTARAAAKGRATLAKLRQEGEDARSAEEVRAQKSTVATRRNAEIAAWDEEHGEAADPELYAREIAPRIASLTARAIAEATGLSVHWAKKMRTAGAAPHPRHWETLRRLVEEAGEEAGGAEVDPALWEEKIAPHLGRFSVREIAEAAGMSLSWAKRVRRGERVPSRRYWPTILQLVVGAGL